MNSRLLEASQTGNINYLHQLLGESPFILNKIAAFSTKNPLHVASVAGHLDFVKELIRLKPEFAAEINEDGFSPLHMAAAAGHVEIVKELVKLDLGLCRLEGKERKSPLHWAAIKGRVEVTDLMLLACPDCILDTTVQGETALHLAVKNCQFKAIKVMVDWIRDMNKENVMNMKDEKGNTVLHLATKNKGRQVINLLLGNGSNESDILEVNAKNDSGLTSLDVLLLFSSEAGDGEIVEILRGAGAMRAKNISSSLNSAIESVDQTSVSIPSTSEPYQISQSNNLLEYFQFKKGRDSPGEARDVLLVFAVLVATATFQVGVSPPGGVWQDSFRPDGNNNTKSFTTKDYAGESVIATSSPLTFCLFILFNSLGFSFSLYMITILTCRFPLQFEMRICMAAMYSTYTTASVSIAPKEVKLYTTIDIVMSTVLAPFIVERLRRYTKIVKEFVMDMFR